MTSLPQFRARCAATRLAHRESLFATAPEHTNSWLLVEHPGPWPSRSLPPDLPHEVALVLKAAEEAGARTQFIRRVRDRRHTPTTVITAHSRAGATWLEQRSLSDPRELADLDVDALADGRPPGFGELSDEHVVLVCTHGLHDVCCARLGRPVAVLLDRTLPGQVWETTHIGGDRFAANVVTLPDGSYHGGITAADIGALAAAVTAGRVLPAHLRGRTGLPAPVQAADHYLRTRLGLLSLDAVRPVRHRPAEDGGTVCVELDVPGDGRYQVRVRPRQATEPRLTSCADSGTIATPATFDLVALERRPA